MLRRRLFRMEISGPFFAINPHQNLEKGFVKFPDASSFR